MLFLVRHAHSGYTPDEMRDLSPAGHASARRLADVLDRHAITRIVSSPYARAIRTVRPLADRLGVAVEIEADLRERRLSAGPVDDLHRCLAATWRDMDFVYPGGESSRAAQARVSRAIRRIASLSVGQNVVIASHGNALALFLHTLDPAVDFAFWMRMTMPDVYAVETRQPEWVYQRAWDVVAT